MQNDTIQILPIDKIRVLNPRTRNQKVFADLVENIATIGLKRPITVTPSVDSAEYYDLLCGQGRLEACQVLGELFIPCRVVNANSEESYLISLVENIARRQHSYMELLQASKYSMIEVISPLILLAKSVSQKAMSTVSYTSSMLGKSALSMR